MGVENSTESPSTEHLIVGLLVSTALLEDAHFYHGLSKIEYSVGIASILASATFAGLNRYELSVVCAGAVIPAAISLVAMHTRTAKELVDLRGEVTRHMDFMEKSLPYVLGVASAVEPVAYRESHELAAGAKIAQTADKAFVPLALTISQCEPAARRKRWKELSQKASDLKGITGTLYEDAWLAEQEFQYVRGMLERPEVLQSYASKKLSQIHQSHNAPKETHDDIAFLNQVAGGRVNFNRITLFDIERRFNNVKRIIADPSL